MNKILIFKNKFTFVNDGLVVDSALRLRWLLGFSEIDRFGRFEEVPYFLKLILDSQNQEPFSPVLRSLAFSASRA